MATFDHKWKTLWTASVQEDAPGLIQIRIKPFHDFCVLAFNILVHNFIEAKLRVQGYEDGILRK